MRESPAEKERLMNKQSNTWISEWNPEDNEFWESQGKTIARRNLIWSIVAEHLGFSIWLIWSIVATKLPQAGFHLHDGPTVSTRGAAGIDRRADAISHTRLRSPRSAAVTGRSPVWWCCSHCDDRTRLFRNSA